VSIEYLTALEADAYLAAKADEHLYILFDSATDKRLPVTLYTLESSPSYTPLLPLAQYEHIAFKGPLLVQATRALLQHLFSGENLGVVIVSPLDLRALATYCRQLFFQEYEGQSVFFRFFDPRVLRSLFDCMDGGMEENFFNTKIDALLVAEKDAAAQRFTRPETEGPPKDPPPFMLSQKIVAAMEVTHTQRKDAQLHACLTQNEMYQSLTEPERQRFLREAKQQAQFFGFTDHDALLLFMPEWFLIGHALQQLPEHMRVLQDPRHTAPDKLSYLYCFRIFNFNPYACPINPVALLARHKLYQALDHRVRQDGSRKPVDLMHGEDRIARMRYNELYRKYEPDAGKLCPAVEKLLRLTQFSMLRKKYDVYSTPYAQIETALAVELEKAVRHG
jgi:hypothetical protein